MFAHPQSHRLKDGREVLLRQPTPEDAEKLIEFVKATNSESRFLGYEPGEFHMTIAQECDYIRRRTKDGCGSCFVAELGGEIAGSCDAVPLRDLYRFRHRATLTLAVLKAFWRLGIGRLLLSAVLTECREKGFGQAELEVVADNIAAIALYESVGFETTGVYKNAFKYADGSYADEYFMWLPLRGKP